MSTEDIFYSRNKSDGEEKNLRKHAKNLLRTLSMAISYKDKRTMLHSLGVRRYSVMIGTQMGFSKAEIEVLKMGALLHDIGKIGVCDSILLKPNKLTDKEYEAVRKHPEIGAKLLEYSVSLEAIIPMVLYHHERFDGCGYPHQLRDEDIPILARIITVADSFEAMTGVRPYRKPWSVQEALLELQHHSGTQFDPRIVDHFIGALKERNPSLMT